jgi:molybdate/tungstate transport system substrate-binding protein
MPRVRTTRRWLLRSTALIAVVSLVALGSSSCSANLASTRAKGTSPQTVHGTASIACAGSLLKLYEDTLGPAFTKATGDSYGGPPCAGSLALAQDILSGEYHPGSFLAIGARAIKELFPAARSRFAMAVAADPLVIGFSKQSRYYSQLNAIRTGKEPLSYLFTLFSSKGFRLGRTDPTQDPQGTFFILMAELAQKVLPLYKGEAEKALGITKTSPYGSKSQIYDETALPTDIATGIVDAGSEYLPEAEQYGLDYISLPPTLSFASPAEAKLYATVSLKVSGSVQPGEVIYLNDTLVLPAQGTSFSPADETADRAFVAFMLQPKARSVLARVGYSLHRPLVVLAPGVTLARALPPAILNLFKSLGGRVTS